MVSLLVLAFAALVSASRHKRSMSLHEHRALPGSFRIVKPAAPDQVLTMRIALHPANQKGLIDALYAVSSPSSVLYGQHLSASEVNAFLAPPPDALAAVRGWLDENGIHASPVSSAGDWLEFSVPAARANDIFEANFTVFQHLRSGTTAVRTLRYSLPSELRGSIALLFPGTSFWSPTSAPRFTPVDVHGIPRPMTYAVDRRQSSISTCNSTITPQCLQSLYGIPATPASIATNRIAVAGFNNQFANKADLKSFLNMTRPEIVNATFASQFVDNGTNRQTRTAAGIGADLNIQYTVGVATGVPAVFVSVGTQNSDGIFGFADLVNSLLGQTNQPQVLISAYGTDEANISSRLSQQLCNSYAALGARGTSIIISAGDGGVSGFSATAKNCTQFRPSLPAGCPYVTSVGATSGVVETAASFSGGGFSNIFARPTYQDQAVNTYFTSTGPPNQGLFNASGRGIPDVSAIGDGILINFMGQFGTVSGSAASSTIFASVIALINDRRAAANMSSLGFLNPFLYENPQAFDDITTGSNPGCGTDGFPASSGWDPVTGLGTPIFSRLAEAAGV